MRPVGIILVFLNLILSIATCALIVVVYSTRSNWKTGFEKAKEQALVSSAALKAEETAHQNDLKGREERIGSLNNQIAGLVKDLETSKANVTQVQQQFAEYQKTSQTHDTTTKAQIATVTQLTKEVESLKAERNSREARIIALEMEKNTERKDRVGAEQKLSSLQNRNEKLNTEFAENQRKLAIAERELGNRGISLGSILQGDVKAPPKDVKGKVVAANAQGMVELNIGSDSGVVEGNELTAARINLVDGKASLYLGTVRISRSEPKKSVGYFLAAPTSRVKTLSPGDDVYSPPSGK